MVLSFCLPTTTKSIDYSRPYNVEPRTAVIFATSQNATLENDWYQVYNSRSLASEYDNNSFRVNAYGVDNYGTPYDLWVSIYAGSGSYSGRILYDSGWRSGGFINDDSFSLPPSGVNSLRIYVRFRYNDSANNPPNLSYFNNVTLNVTYNALLQIQDTQTTAIPEYWGGTQTVTVSTMDLGSFGQQTTSVAVDSFIQNASEDIEYSFATIFGLLDSGESLIVVMNYLDDKLPYLYAITFFSLLTAIGVWAIR